MANTGEIYEAAVQLRTLLRKGVGVAPQPGSEESPLQVTLDRLLALLDTELVALRGLPAADRGRVDLTAVQEAATAGVRLVRIKAAPGQTLAVAESVSAALI